MLEWIANAVGSFTGWLGDGVGAALDWLLGGLAEMFTLIFDAAGGLWDALESLWGLGMTFIDSLLSLVTNFFPFVPAPVVAVLSGGLIAVIIIGFVKKVRA